MSMITVPVDRRLWSSFVTFAKQKRIKPPSLLADLLKEYLETEQDKKLDGEMQRDLRGRELSNRQAVRFVHQRRRKRMA
jgi:hypothetical protein